MEVRSEVPAALRTRDPAVFQEAVNSSFVPLRLEMPDDGRFRGALSVAGADGVAFSQVASSSSHVGRTPETIALGGSGYYKLSLQLRGTSLLTQGGRQVVMSPGAVHFYDTSRPYSLDFDGDICNLVVMFRKDRLDLPSSAVDTLTAVPLAAQHPLGRTIAPLIAQASPLVATTTPATRTRLARATIDVLTVVLSAILDIEAERQESSPALLRRVQSYIVQNLASQKLAPGDIAAAQFVSVRRLHALFRASGTTVGSWTLQERLKRCRQELIEPESAHRGIAEIAAGWGLTDAAHFSRAFRSAYGVAPRQFRAQEAR